MGLLLTVSDRLLEPVLISDGLLGTYCQIGGNRNCSYQGCVDQYMKQRLNPRGILRKKMQFDYNSSRKYALANPNYSHKYNYKTPRRQYNTQDTIR